MESPPHINEFQLNGTSRIGLDQLLKENNLRKVKLKNSHNIFESISFCLYGEIGRAAEVEKCIKQSIFQLLNQKRHQTRLEQFKKNQHLLVNYQIDSQTPHFQNTNLYLTSLFYHKQVILYSPGLYLQASLYNASYSAVLSLCQDEDVYYPLVSSANYRARKYAFQLLSEILQLNFGITAPNPLGFKEKLYLARKSRLNVRVPAISNQHKKSYSDENGRTHSSVFDIFQSNQKVSYNYSPSSHFPIGPPPGIHSDKPFLPAPFAPQNYLSNLTSSYFNQGSENLNKQLFFINKQISPECLSPYNKENQDPSLKKKGKNKPIIIENSKERFLGKLKFFDELKNYGFIVMDADETDAFVHFDDLRKANISKVPQFHKSLQDFLRTVKLGNEIRFSFNLIYYSGKYSKSRKAIDLELLP